MAAVAPQADQAADMFQKMSLDTQSKANDIPEATKKPSVDSGNNTKGAQPDRSFTPLLPDFSDPAMYYQNPYSSTMYYGGYEASANEWEDYARFMNSDGVEMNPGNYGENGSLMYPHAYGYTPYGPYSPAVSPVPTTGHDGQMYGAQHYQYPYYPSMTPTSGPYTPSAATAKGDHTTAAAGDQVPLSVDSTNSKSNGIVNGAKGAVPTRPAYQNSSYNANGTYGRGNFPGANASGYQDARYGFDALQSPWLESHYYQDGLTRPVTSSSVNSSGATGNGNHSSRTQNYQPQLMMAGVNAGQYGNSYRSGMGHSMYPNKMYAPYGNSYRSAMGYGSNVYDSRTSGRSWMSVDSKLKPRGRGVFGYGNESIDGLNELNRGPRAKFTKPKGFTPVALSVKGQNVPFVGATDDEKQQKLSSTPDRELYNRTDFPETYTDAKFFIIKSYSEDDVHKSIKYNVWASTPNGNKKLDAAYQDAQQKPGGCPIFLFFSVNTSGQFVGVAEMIGPVDFEKNVEYWQQDKWIGCFPVKWHIVKDLPNTSLKHIILENNESKPVTNSRDTQEVKLDQGLEVLKIFKEHTSKQCILDDFDFYEDRQKRIQDKKAKQQLYQKQAQRVWEGKASEEKTKDASNGDAKTDKSSEVASDLSTPAIQDSENKSGEVDKTAKPAEKLVVANGVANGC